MHRQSQQSSNRVVWNHVSCQKIVQWLVQVRPRAMAFEEDATKMKVFGEVESL